MLRTVGVEGGLVLLALLGGARIPGRPVLHGLLCLSHLYGWFVSMLQGHVEGAVLQEAVLTVSQSGLRAVHHAMQVTVLCPTGQQHKASVRSSSPG